MKNVLYVIIGLLLLYIIFRPPEKVSVVKTEIDTIYGDTVKEVSYIVDTVYFTKYKTIKDTVYVLDSSYIKESIYDFDRATLSQRFKVNNGPDELIDQNLEIRDSVKYINNYITNEIIKTKYIKRSGQFITASYNVGYKNNYYMVNYGMVRSSGFMYSLGFGVDESVKPVAGINIGVLF